MPDRKEVIEGLKILKSDLPSFDLYGYGDNNHFATALVNDAITLLEEQEAVRPKYIDGKRNHFIKCGKCNTDLMRGMKYCSYCGTAVKWE